MRVWSHETELAEGTMVKLHDDLAEQLECLRERLEQSKNSKTESRASLANTLIERRSFLDSLQIATQKLQWFAKRKGTSE